MKCTSLPLQTPRVHHAARRRGGGVAARGARAAARADAAHRRAHATRRGRSGSVRPASRRSHRGCSNWAGRSAATCGSTTAGPQAMPSAFADTRRNWSRSRRTSSWPLARSTVGPLLQATRTVPIVFVKSLDPVGAGFVDSLARPGGNATGFTTFEYSISGKWLELLKEIAPRRDARGGPSGSRHGRRDRPVRRHPGRGAVASGWS